MNLTIVSSAIFLAVGAAVTGMSLALPDASIGIPQAPKIFPAGLGILMMALSLVELAKEGMRVRRDGKGEGAEPNPYLGRILLTSVFAVLYALIFKHVGYVLSTFLLLESELWLFNGGRNWKVNTLVAFLFSISIYLLFAKALGVYLPMTPIIWF